MSDNNMAQKIALLNEYGQAMRNYWGDIDGRGTKLTLARFVEWVLDESKPFDIAVGRDILDVCKTCGQSWDYICSTCKGEKE